MIARVLSGSWRSPSVAVDLSEKDLDEISPLLCHAGLAALAWFHLRDSQLAQTRSGQALQQGYRLQVLQNAIRREKIELIHRLLAERGIPAIMIKGWTLSGLYQDQNSRRLGDIDLVVQPDYYAAAAELVKSSAARGCLVDLHSELVELSDRQLNQLFARSQLMKLEPIQVRVLSVEDQLALLTIHFLKHGAWWPVWLCDIGALVESLPPSFDWNLCLGNNARRASWIKSAIALAGDLLGAKLDRLDPAGRTKEVPGWLIESTLKQWGNLLSDRLPIRPRPLISQAPRRPAAMVKAVIDRWPDPITATLNMGGGFDDFPRFPYQLGSFVTRGCGYVIGKGNDLLGLVKSV